ncbi:DNA ligase 1-like isoform X2 [Amphibalanus amphitrite]|uniref:DNA ligase 1-like isoform X2 n=1 Tax=Amphibalanus amphitrite TaxID=1232801 RepID=UPI001C90F87A|nr:DNA ligase 1-like isoform X2 [Amphibalanus amphitrite]
MAKAAKTPVKTPAGTPGPKTPKMKPQQTPKGGAKPQTPGMKNGTTPGKTPKKTPKPQPDTPMPPRQTPKSQPQTPKPQQQKTPKPQQPAPKQKTPQQQKQINPQKGKWQKSPKEQAKMVGPNAKAARDTQARTVRLTFPAGTLQSVEQVKKLVPTATSVKFPNVVFVEFGSEAEADKQHSKLQPLIADGQLNQVNFVGEKEREFQSNNRGMDNTRLFVRGIGSAVEADIKKLFPTAISVVIRGTNNARGKSHQHKYCFVVFATAAACTEALEKSKGLTLFGNPLTVSYAFLRKAPGADAKAEKRPAEAATTAVEAPAKKVKVEPKVEEEEDDDEDDDEEDEEEEGEDDEDDDEEGDDDEDDEEGDDDDDEDDDDEDDDEDDDDDDDDDEE